MNEPSLRVPSTPVQRGSLLAGVASAWALLIGGYMVVAALFSAVGTVTPAIGMLIVALPWLAMIGLLVWFATNGRPRSAIGVLIGIGTIIAVALLLVAACFGLLSGGLH